MPERWEESLSQLQDTGMLRILRTIEGAQGPRVLVGGREVVLLCSNNYLGLANHPRLVEAAVEATERYGVGSGASRLVSGSMEMHVALEERLAVFKQTESALLFNSGFAANTGILQGLLDPEDVIFSDDLNHASIIDGCRLAKARTVVYPHRDVNTLEELLRQEQSQRKGRFLIVTDGVFSMDGDIAQLPELVELKKRYDALLMVDDAHGSGVLGAHGRGTGEHFGLLEGIDLHMGTLGKAFGVCGAYLAASKVVIETLINRCRPFIFSTSLSPSVPAAAMAALDIIESDEGAERRRRLRHNTEVFSSTLRRAGFDLLQSATQIVPVMTGEPEPTMAATEALLQRGFFMQGIRPPTVAPGTCRLRATLMADHQESDVLAAAEAVCEILSQKNHV